MNDHIAMSAWQFLQLNARSGSSRPRVIGFDNIPLSLAHGVTTWGSRYDILGRLAVQCLVHPRAVGANRGHRIQVKGTLVERNPLTPTRLGTLIETDRPY